MPEETTQPTETKVDDKLNLVDSLTKAVEDNKAKVETKEETKVEAKAETKEESAKAADDELSDEELAHAKNLFLLLKNPASSKQVVEILAKQAGLVGDETKQEQKEVAKTLTDLLKEELGEEYAFMADKLAPAIEKAVKVKVDEHTKEIRERFEADSTAKVEAEVNTGLENLAKDHDDAEDFYEDIYKLMDTHPPDAKATAREYFEDLYWIAKGRKSSESVKAKIQDKVAKNRADASSRLASGGKGTTVKGETMPSKMSLDESIRAAMESIK